MGRHAWHIIRVKSGDEAKAASILPFPCYVPHLKSIRFNRKLRKKHVEVKPALPGFVFVKTNVPHLVALRPGLHMGWMRNGDSTKSGMTNEEIRVMRRIELDFWLKTEDTKTIVPVVPVAKIGDAVQFQKGGPLAGIRAMIRKLDGDRVLLELIDNGLNVEANISDVVAA